MQGHNAWLSALSCGATQGSKRDREGSVEAVVNQASTLCGTSTMALGEEGGHDNTGARCTLGCSATQKLPGTTVFVVRCDIATPKGVARAACVSFVQRIPAPCSSSALSLVQTMFCATNEAFHVEYTV